MKKLFAMFVVAGMVAFVACGPSAEEKEQQRIADSTKAADSVALVAAEQTRLADSVTQATVAADSLAKADSIAKAK